MNTPLLFDWMRPLGWALLHFVWQGTAIAVLLALVLRLMRKCRPQARGTAAIVALLIMAACPVFTAISFRPGRVNTTVDTLEQDRPAQALPLNSPGEPVVMAAEPMDIDSEAGEMRTRILPAETSASQSPAVVSLFSRKGMRQQFTRLMPWGVWVWLAGVTLLALWRLGGWLLIGRWVRHGLHPVPPRWSAALTDLVRETGLRRPVRLLASLKVAVPVTAGWLRPVILFPAALLSGLPPRHVEALLAHELAHIRRMDYAVNLAQTVLETLLFYHPAVWWTGRIIRQEREHSCDDAAIAIHGDVGDYATALASLAGMNSPVLLPAAKGGSLLLRLRRLLTPQSVPGPALRIPASMVAAGAALGIALLLVNPPSGVAETKSGMRPEKSPLAAAAPEPVGTSGGLQPGEPVQNSREPEKPAPAPATVALPARGRILDRNGLALANDDDNGARVYPWGSLAAHAVGWSASKGKSGTEAKFDKILTEGKDVSLTLDIRLQLIVEKAMVEAGVGRGAAVVLDPQNGDLLAMTSFPNFDPGIFRAPKENAMEIQKAYQDPTQPFYDRAIRPDSPGSVYKVVTAVATCRAGFERRQYNCAGFVDYGRPLACWIYGQQHGKHGMLDLTGALRCSCNCWFFQAGNAVGIDRLAETARLLGMDASFTDINGSEPVTVPDKKWWAAIRGTPWTAAETANCSIGQGFVQESPVHMASLAATVANRGNVWTPRLNLATPAVCTQKQVLPEKQMDVIRNGMREVVNDSRGTGKNAKSRQFTVAGKTGTAQKQRVENDLHAADNRAWFIGFAPFENPRFAVCVLVLNGEAGGKVSAPIAKSILEQAMVLKDHGPAPAPERRPVVQGHFRPVP